MGIVILVTIEKYLLVTHTQRASVAQVIVL